MPSTPPFQRSPFQRRYTRRAALGTLAALGAASFVGSRSPVSDAAAAVSCSLAPSMTEGPFFVDEKLKRYDLTTGTTDAGTLNGVPLYLNITAVSTTSGCAPIAGVQIDIWHCNANGLYSDISTGQGQSTGTRGQTFLRGYQLTDAGGAAAFKTIYPGWYSGRTVHIHVKARLYNAAGNTTYEFNTQLFFDDALTDVVFAQAPYNARGTRNVRNAQDGIYGSNTSVLLALRRPADGSAGYVADFTLGLAVAATQSASTVDLHQQGLTGFWFDPAIGGQGLGLEVYPDLVAAGTGLAQLGWFTFEDGAPGGADTQRWYTMSGPMASGRATADLTIYRNIGGNFAAGPITSAQAVGTATLAFSSCTTGQLSYAFNDGSGRTGTIPLSRLTTNVNCSTSAARPTNADFSLSGNYGDLSTSGQGLIVEANPLSPVLFFAWYTYAPQGQAIGGGASQRWYTGQANVAVAGARSFDVTLYETTGGVFDSASASTTRTVAVGNATLHFASCSSASLVYAFDSGTNAGRTGTLALARIGPVAPGCVA